MQVKAVYLLRQHLNGRPLVYHFECYFLVVSHLILGGDELLLFVKLVCTVAIKAQEPVKVRNGVLVVSALLGSCVIAD